MRTGGKQNFQMKIYMSPPEIEPATLNFQPGTVDRQATLTVGEMCFKVLH